MSRRLTWDWRLDKAKRDSPVDARALSSIILITPHSIAPRSLSVSAANPAIPELLVLVLTPRTPDIEGWGGRHAVRDSRDNVQRHATPKGPSVERNKHPSHPSAKPDGVGGLGGVPGAPRGWMGIAPFLPCYPSTRSRISWSSVLICTSYNTFPIHPVLGGPRAGPRGVSPLIMPSDHEDRGRFPLRDPGFLSPLPVVSGHIRVPGTSLMLA